MMPGSRFDLDEALDGILELVQVMGMPTARQRLTLVDVGTRYDGIGIAQPDQPVVVRNRRSLDRMCSDGHGYSA